MKNLKYILLICLGIGLTNCSDLLEADNPNNLLEEDLGDPRAFGPMVNGVETTVIRAYGNMLAPYSTASDEMIWIGSRDAWNQLNFGQIANVNNEFSDAAFFWVGEARWWADEVISRAEGFRNEGTFLAGDENSLARAYLYGAFTYMFIADMFDDFVVNGSKLDPGTPVGSDNMSSLYQTAIGYINTGLGISGISEENKTALTGLLARAQFSNSLWLLTNPVNTANPLVNDASAAATAQSALELMSDDYAYTLNTSAAASGTVGGLDIAGEVNSRLEMRLSDEYVISDGKRVVGINDGDAATSISLMDPIDEIPDPALHTLVQDFTIPQLYPSYPIVSAREMHLILAEVALAGGDDDGFAMHINNLRALDGLTPYSGQIDAVDLLHHARRVNLFLSGRRIADHYRFDSPSVYWIPTSDAINNPGTFFPITISEIRANPSVN